MPLWVQIPVVCLLCLTSWIFSLDGAGAASDNYVLWGVTAILTAHLFMRLARAA